MWVIFKSCDLEFRRTPSRSKKDKLHCTCLNAIKGFCLIRVIKYRDPDTICQACSGHLTSWWAKWGWVEKLINAYLDEDVTTIWEILREIWRETVWSFHGQVFPSQIVQMYCQIVPQNSQIIPLLFYVFFIFLESVVIWHISISVCFFHNLLQDQWDSEHNRQQSNLEKKYQENLAEFGLGHKTASEVLWSLKKCRRPISLVARDFSGCSTGYNTKV